MPTAWPKGLEGFDSPLVGLTYGLAASVAAYALGLLLVARKSSLRWSELAPEALSLKVVAGLFVALSTWARWAALDLASVGTVLALGLMSVPVVLLLSPLVAGRALEQINGTIWTGAALVVGGSLLLVARTL